MKTKQLTLITLLLFAFATGAFAQGFIEGTVYEEAENGQRTPLPGVALELPLFITAVHGPSLC